MARFWLSVCGVLLLSQQMFNIHSLFKAFYFSVVAFSNGGLKPVLEHWRRKNLVVKKNVEMGIKEK